MKTKLLILLIGIAFVGCSGDDEDIEISPVMGDVLQEWESIDTGIKTNYYLVKMGMGLNMKINSPMSSDYNNPGIPVYGNRVEGGIRYDYDNGHGEYYISETNGNLVLYNKNGELSRVEEVNLNNRYQIFPTFDIAIKCPCNLLIDSAAIESWEEDSLKVISFKCKDKASKALYLLNALPEKDDVYTDEEIIRGITASLDSNKSVTYEMFYKNNCNGIVINYLNTRMKSLDLFSNKASIHFRVKTIDSIDTKFDNYINSMVMFQ